MKIEQHEHTPQRRKTDEEMWDAYFFDTPPVADEPSRTEPMIVSLPRR